MSDEKKRTIPLHQNLRDLGDPGVLQNYSMVLGAFS